MKKIILLTVIIAIVSCDERSNLNDSSVEEINEYKENISQSEPDKKERFEDMKYIPIKFKETSLIKEGDSITIYGGEEKYLSKNFVLDSCRGIVEQVFFSKPMGQLAFVNIDNSKDVSKHLAISLYYWDSKRGYKEAYLEKWNKIPTDEEARKASYNLGFGPSFKYEVVDVNIGFNKLN